MCLYTYYIVKGILLHLLLLLLLLFCLLARYSLSVSQSVYFVGDKSKLVWKQRNELAAAA